VIFSSPRFSVAKLTPKQEAELKEIMREERQYSNSGDMSFYTQFCRELYAETKVRGLVLKRYTEYFPICVLKDWCEAKGYKPEGDFLNSATWGVKHDSSKPDDQKCVWHDSMWTGRVVVKGYDKAIEVVCTDAPTGTDYTVHYFVIGQTAEDITAFMDDLRKWEEAKVRFDERCMIWPNRTIPRPKLTWDDLCMPEVLKKSIRTNIEAFFKSKESYKTHGLQYRRGLLFVGSPGNGKSTCAKVVASQYTDIYFLIFSVDRNTTDDDFRRAFGHAATKSPCILLIEDLDKLNPERVPISSFLGLLDGFETKEGVLVIATSNEPHKLDKALAQRPSRFDRMFAFDMPKKEHVLELLKRRAGKFFDEAELAEVADGCKDFSMAYVQEIVVNCLLHCIHRGREPRAGDLKKSLTALKAQMRQVKQIYDTGDTKGRNMGFSASGDSLDMDPWDEEEIEAPGWTDGIK